MRFIDISWPITHGMTEYKDRKSVSLTAIKTIAADKMRESMLGFHSHTGTHVDAPAHFMPDGATIEKEPYDHLIGPCRVIDLTHCSLAITRADLERKDLHVGERILLKTINSKRSADEVFDPAFIYVAGDAAEYFVEKKIKTIGIDYLGIERNQPDRETHLALMRGGITIIEGLRLADVASGQYQLICLPLLIPGCDAAPARAVLVQE
jgi:arylformamidase